MSEKSIFDEFLAGWWKHAKNKYPFIHKMKESLDLSLPKKSCFYLGVSPAFGKHVIIKFFYINKPWRVGEFTIRIHISDEYGLAKRWDVLDELYDTFQEGMYSLPIVAIGKDKYWCLKKNDNLDDSDKYTEYWRPSSYEENGMVVEQAIKDVCLMLEEHVFMKGGYF